MRSSSRPAHRIYRAPALEKGLDVLELLAERGSMTPSDISIALGRTLSELFRMMMVLEYKGYVAPSGNGGGYELTNKIFGLGMAYTPVKVLIEAALPAMRRLANEINQSCHLVVPADGGVAIVARVENPGFHGFSVRTGHHRKMVEATSGPVLYAFQSADTQAQWHATLFADLDESRRDDFMAAVRSARQLGYRFEASSLVECVRDICFPIITAAGAPAALTVPYLKHERGLPPEETIKIARDAAEAIALTLSASRS